MNWIQNFVIAGVFTLLALAAAPPNMQAQADFALKQVVLECPQRELPASTVWNSQNLYPQDNTKRSRGKGLLASLMPETGDVRDRTPTSVQSGHLIFDADRFKRVPGNDQVSIDTGQPIVHCTMQAPPELQWIRSAKDYSPNPFNVKCVVHNNGDLEAKNARFKIVFSPADFMLRSPITDVQPGTPVDVLAGQTSEATWNMAAKTRLSADSALVRIEISFDNHETISCSKKIFIPPTEPILECAIQAVTIIADQDLQRYTPMPFPINVNVINRGGMKTDSVYATIVLPPGDLRLAANETQTTKKVMPGMLLPNQSAYISWQLTHPATLTEKQYFIKVWTNTSNADSSMCEVRVTIPELEAPVLQAQCNVPDTLRYNLPGNSHEPNPFDVVVSVANTGTMPVENVTAFLYLPDGVEIDPSSQPLQQTLGTLGKWNVGDSIPSCTWTLRYTDRPDTPQELLFKFAVGGTSAVGGIPVDSSFAVCSTHVEAIPPPFTCTLEAPDTLRLNDSGTGVEPNPFTLFFRVANSSQNAETLDEIKLFFPTGSGSLLPLPGNEQTRTVNQIINPGDTAVFRWEFQARTSFNSEDIAFSTIGKYNEGKSIHCQAQVHRQAILAAMSCNLSLDKPIITYDTASQSYPDPTVTVSATIQNLGGLPLANVYAELRITDPGGFLELDPAYPNDNPWTQAALFGGQTANVEWRFRLAKNIDSLPSQFVDFSVWYGSNEVPRVENLCTAQLVIESIFKQDTPFICTIDAPDTLRLNAAGTGVEPNQFTIRYSVTNQGANPAVLTQVVCYFPNDGIKLRSILDNTQTRIFRDTLTTNETSSYEWTFDVSGRPHPRALTIQVVAFDDEGNPIPCEKTIYIEALPSSMSCSLASVPLVLAYDTVSQSYSASTVEVTATLTNSGSFNLSNITAEIQKNDPSGLLEFDPMFAGDNTNPKTKPVLFQGQAYNFSWGFRLAHPNESGVDQMVEFCVSYGSDELPLMDNQCCGTVIIEPYIVTGIQEPGTSVPTFSLAQNYPNPFSSSTDIAYSVGAESEVSLTVHNILGKRVAMLAEGRKAAGQYSARFEAKDLPGGVYVVRMNAPHFSQSRLILLHR